MKHYNVIFEKGGKQIATYAVHAASPADAQVSADHFFTDYPEFSIFGGNEGLEIRVEEIRHTD